MKAPSVSDLLFRDGTPKKAFFTALIVGSILTAINHGDLLLEGSYPSPIKIALTYCVPYVVTTWGAATGKIAQWKRDSALP
jgi:hypothetical protein